MKLHARPILNGKLEVCNGPCLFQKCALLEFGQLSLTEDYTKLLQDKVHEQTKASQHSTQVGQRLSIPAGLDLSFKPQQHHVLTNARCNLQMP